MGEKGFALIEVALGLLLLLIIFPTFFSTLFVWGRNCNQQSSRISIQQNSRMVLESIARELRYDAGEILVPAVGCTSNYLEFENPCSYRKYRYYVNQPSDFADSPTLYRAVTTLGGLSTGIDQLTEPSRVRVQKVSFCQISRGVLKIKLVLSDEKGKLQLEQETVVRCLNSSGSSSILGIIILSIIFVAAGTMLKVNMSELEIGKNHADGVVAQHFAELGALRAIFELEQSFLWGGFSEIKHINGIDGTVNVQVIKPASKGNVLWVRSTGVISRSERIITFAYVLPPDFDNDVYKYTVFAGKNLEVSSAESIDGLQVGSRQYTYIDGQYAAKLSGKQEELPKIQKDSYSIGNTIPPTNEEISSGLGLRGHIYYYCPSSILTPYTVKSYCTLRGNGVIFSDYHIHFEKNVVVSDRVTLIAQNNIFVDQDCRINKALLIAGHDIVIGDNVHFNGIIIAKGNVKIGKNTIIHRDDSVLKMIRTNYNNYY